MPLPTPVEPSFSRCCKISKTACSFCPERTAAFAASSCRSCFLLPTFSAGRMASGAIRSVSSMGLLEGTRLSGGMIRKARDHMWPPKTRQSASCCRPGSTRTFEPAFVAAQPPLDTLCCPIGAGIGVGLERLGLEHHTRVQMDHAFGAKPETLLANGDVSGISAIEEFGSRLRDARIDARAQRFSQIHVLTGHPKRHVALPPRNGQRTGIRQARARRIVVHAAAAPTTEYASPPDTSRRSG